MTREEIEKAAREYAGTNFELISMENIDQIEIAAFFAGYELADQKAFKIATERAVEIDDLNAKVELLKRAIQDIEMSPRVLHQDHMVAKMQARARLALEALEKVKS